MSYVGIELNKLGMHVLTQYNDYLKLKKKKTFATNKWSVDI